MRLFIVALVALCCVCLAIWAYAASEDYQPNIVEEKTEQDATAEQGAAGVAEAVTEAEAEEAAQDEEPQDFLMTYEATFASNYVWRGVMITDGAVFQPSITITEEGLSANVWGNLDLSDINGRSGELSEMDITFDYTHGFDKFSTSAGVIHYTFPHAGAAPTSEAYAGVAFGGALNPSLFAYYDFGQANGTWIGLDLSHSFPAGKERTLEVATGAGWGSAASNDYNFGVHQAGLTDLRISAGIPFETKCGLCVTPVVSYSRVLDGALRDAVDDKDMFTFSLLFGFGE